MQLSAYIAHLTRIYISLYLYIFIYFSPIHHISILYSAKQTHNHNIMSYKPAIASHSLGRAWVHDIEPKLRAAAAAGIPGIEIFYEDLHYLAESLPGGATPANQIAAAQITRSLCDLLSLDIVAIGPFSNYEGNLSPESQASLRSVLQVWFRVAEILGTDLVQIPSTFMTEKDGFTGDLDVVVKDLRVLADMGERNEPKMRFAYENLSFGTWVSTWKDAWDVVKAVDRENFGLCLDTFNIAAREYGDPASESCMVDNAEVEFDASMKRMVEEIDPRKVFYVQVVDVERMKSPLVEGHEFWVKEQTPRMSWSRNARLFMFEEERGGFLPVLKVLKAICDGLGYKGWISAELFNRSLVEKGEHVPIEHADRCMRSWEKIAEAMGWDVRVASIDKEHENDTEKGDANEIFARL